jgi:putative ABC transport system permease protein
MYVVVRSSSAPGVAVSQLRQAVQQLNPDVAISELRFMDQIAGEALSSQRFASVLLGLFAALALALATFGMYGAISYSVNRRMGEFGLRMALGARPSDLLRLILGQGLPPRGARRGRRIPLRGQRDEIAGNTAVKNLRTDPVTLAAVALLARATSTLACYLPARRATGAGPMRSLRSG